MRGKPDVGSREQGARPPKRGQIIGVQAYGTDTAGATAEFKPIGFAAASDIAVQTFSSGTIGVVSQFTVPTGLPTGPLLVQLRVR